jgi:hypothetical protein
MTSNNHRARAACHPHPTSQRHAPVVFLEGFPAFVHNEPVRHGRILLLLVFSLFVIVPPALTAKARHTPLPPTPATPSRDYVSALGTANRFLNAWQVQDHEAGLLLLSDAAKQQWSETRLQNFFSPETTTQRGFQIAHGKKLRPGRYLFAVSLLENGGKTTRVRSSQLIVIQTGGGDWVVDKLP